MHVVYRWYSLSRKNKVEISKLELWRSTLESSDCKLNRIKKEYMACDLSKIRNRDEDGIKIEDHEVLKKYPL